MFLKSLNKHSVQYFIVELSLYNIQTRSFQTRINLGGGTGVKVKVELLPIDNDSEKKEIAKKYKLDQIP